MTARRAIPQEVADSVLADSRRHPRMPTRRAKLGPEQRIHTRFDKVFTVGVMSEVYGDCAGVARNISTGGILLEMPYQPPLGSLLMIEFRAVRDDGSVDVISARAEVKHHHYLNYVDAEGAASTRAVGLRFLEFVGPDDGGVPH